MKKLGLLKENSGVSVVVLTPDNVKKLVQNYSVLVQKGAGELAGFSDLDYALAGARMAQRDYILEHAEIIVTHSSDVNFSPDSKKKTVIGSYSVLEEFSQVLQFKNNPIDFYSLALLPNISAARPMDILSSQAAVAGYQSVIKGFNKSKVISPIISSVGGILYPVKVLVLGTGTAGIQAIETAKGLGAIVSAFDLDKQSKDEVENLGASFIEVEEVLEDEVNEACSTQPRKDSIRMAQDAIRHHLKEADLMITTARISGKTAPVLVTKEMLKEMKPGSVVIDLLADTGGCEGINNDRETLVENVLLVCDAALYNDAARSTSILLGNNYTAFLEHFRINEANTEDEILIKTLVTRDGKVVHQQLIAEVNSY